MRFTHKILDGIAGSRAALEATGAKFIRSENPTRPVERAARKIVDILRQSIYEALVPLPEKGEGNEADFYHGFSL